MPEHVLDSGNGCSGFSVEGRKGSAKAMLGHIAESEPFTDAAKNLLAELGAVGVSVLRWEDSRAEGLRQSKDGCPEPFGNRKHA